LIVAYLEGVIGVVFAVFWNDYGGIIVFNSIGFSSGFAGVF
jgi:hypothetical protein